MHDRHRALLDTDPPLHGLAAQTGQQLMLQAQNQGCSHEACAQQISLMRSKRQA
ncbi:hypothetical protein [Pseudomonas sp. TWR2-1-1]|uniref:hypothetical protein n=1 Tax=Pseudomonas sp. TWR2-1-1 TaxID=2804610 RepID=UPI003CEDC2AF